MGDYFHGRDDPFEVLDFDGNLLMAQGAQDLWNALSGGTITGGYYNSTNACLSVADGNPTTGAGNATFTTGSTAVTFASSQTFNLGDNLSLVSDGNWYTLASAVAASTSGTLSNTYTGVTGTGAFQSIPAVGGGNVDNAFTSTAVGGNITAVANTSNPQITTTSAHGLLPGQAVLIAGIVGATGANGTWIVLATPTTTTYTITVSAPGVWSSGGTTNLVNKFTQQVSGAPTLNPAVGGAITNVSNVANPTITTTSAHGLVVGNNVTIAGLVGSTGVNGTFSVATVPTSTTFTVIAGAPGAYTSGGTVNLVGVQYSAVFAAANANYRWNEFALSNRGLQNGVSVQVGAHLFNRKVIAMLQKFSSTSSTFTLTLTVQ